MDNINLIILTGSASFECHHINSLMPCRHGEKKTETKNANQNLCIDWTQPIAFKDENQDNLDKDGRNA